MPTTIEVNKQSVCQLLEGGKEHPFVIPEYQRPYAWEEEEVDTLFQDLWDFTETNGGAERSGTYFLGSVVSFINENGEQEIIDGQQRITSLFLLLRAIYTKLKTLPQSNRSDNFIRQIENAIWQADKIEGIIKTDESILESRAVNDENNKVLLSILQSGIADAKATDNYSKNYLRFQQLFEQASQENPLQIYDFIYALLRQAILLPISADTQDTALTIFSTLNDRGKPLSDADIFKAGIYNKLDAAKKAEFIERWKNLEEKAEVAEESIQQLFYYYMFYLRAQDGDCKTTTPGLRKYFSDKKAERLFQDSLMTNLERILTFWSGVKSSIDEKGTTWKDDASIRTTLDILTSYPNEFWKYPVISYYLQYENEEWFNEKFLQFLKKLASELLAKYLVSPTINSVKGDILKLNHEIIKSATPSFEFKLDEEVDLSARIKTPHRKVERMLLKVIAYSEQQELLPEKWHIEHILPQRWQPNYTLDASEKSVREKIEHIGNKVPFEERLNIAASNGYFGRKKDCYKKSKIQITRKLGDSPKLEWGLEEITENDVHTAELIARILQEWKVNYRADGKNAAYIPTPEELEQIKRFRELGVI